MEPLAGPGPSVILHDSKGIAECDHGLVAVGCVLFWQIPGSAGRLCQDAPLCKFLFPIQAPILNGLTDMGGGELPRPSEVGYGSRDLQHAVIGARG